jgi:hypothetical protein
MFCEGTDGGVTYGFFWDDSVIDQNNDYSVLHSVNVRNINTRALYVTGGQSRKHLFIDCNIANCTYGVYTDAGFTFVGGSVGNASSSAFYIDEPNGPFKISYADFENCDRFLVTDGPSSGDCPVMIDSVRFTLNALNADTQVVIYKYRGPFVLKNSLFSNGGPMEIRLDWGAGGAHAQITDNTFRGNEYPAENPYNIKSTIQNRVILARNLYGAAGSSASNPDNNTFTDGDATPSVLEATVVKTANTTATTITDLDDGYVGQTVKVIIGDANTTIDFTSSGLKGNGGADWSPTTGDHMTCVYDGTDWYCDVSDNTA